ncbi:endonuclease/exonuclease/phosphatase family protein [Qipengyuania gaetbuli]|uniref:endonuclease/exonuclease/phosphatase family protein n=1 Tax=Qipengyuania gaetbuli TaxID=266952 RepID=UPI001C9970E4|nr:endonuclease/exonuclease/phosphatase family protein [Qipengyuania gaetbuli]MBY6014077.1 endonuclease/exonuclease/phosphatase family protein [Qipengyuania gaetbuli]
MSTIKLVNWNLEWAPPSSARGSIIREILAEQSADVICLTEAHEDNFPQGYHVITSHHEYGYPIKPDRRKVLLGSKTPWLTQDNLGNDLLPPGRYICGLTKSSIGQIRIVGICIPWSGAHVSSGSRDRVRWQDHEAFLDGFRLTEPVQEDVPCMIVGDFNQAIPRTRQPERVATKLEQAFHRMNIITREFEFAGRPTIDHIAVSKSLRTHALSALSDTMDGVRLSDHFGLAAEVTRAKPNAS